MENLHLETFKAEAQGNGWPTKVSITDTEWKLQLDEPAEDGGSNSGANPILYPNSKSLPASHLSKVVCSSEGRGLPNTFNPFS